MPITATRTPTRDIHERARVPLALCLAGRALRGLGLLPLALLGSLALLSTTPAGAQTTVWSATLTVGEAGFGSYIYRGCDGVGDEACFRKVPTRRIGDHKDELRLSTSKFTYKGVTYDIRRLTVAGSGSLAGRLDFELSRSLPSALEDNATLKVGSLTRTMASSTKGGFNYSWGNTGLSLNVDQRVAVSLTLPTTAKTLTPSNITATAARLTIANHTAAWWYKRTVPAGGSCNSATAGTTRISLTGLTAYTSYTYKAYSAAGCSTANEIAGARATFLTAAPGAPTLTTSVLSQVSYTGTARTTPVGSNAWNESYTFTSGTALSGAITPGTVNCAAGTTAEIGWYWHAAPWLARTRVGSTTSAAGVYTLSYTPTSPGEYLALAFCTKRSGLRKGYSPPVNLMRGGAVTVSGPPATLTVSNITATAARITIANHTVAGRYTASWWYKQTAPSAGTCTSRRFGTSSRNLTGLTASTSYTYKAYSAAGCNTADEIASVTFMTGTGTGGQSDPGNSDPEAGATASVSLSAAPNPVDEGRPVTVTATLSKALPSRVTIPLAVTNVTAEDADYTAPPSIVIDAGSTTGTSSMNTARDTDGDDETFRVGVDRANLPSSVTAGDAASTTVTITDTGTGTAQAPVLFPSPPATVRADPGDGQAVLSWSAVVGAGGWEVQQGSSAWTATGSHATTHTVTGLTNGTAYTFKVRATSFNGLIKGNASEGVTVTAGLPSAPDAVASVRVSHRGTSLGVTWDAPARATHYDVGWSADGGATWTEAASNRAGTGLSITGTAGTKSYTVRVRARNAGGQAGWTSSASVSFAAPAAPASVSATHNGTSLSVSWDASAQAESYAVAYSGDGGGSWETATPKQTGTSLTIGGVASGTAYTVRVRARNTAGSSGWTRSASASSGAPVPTEAPDAVASVSVTHNGSSLVVSWAAPARATHYDVTYYGGGVNARAAWNRAGTSLTITCDVRTGYENQHCVAGATAYTVGVRARNAAGESAWTNSAQVSLAAPDAVASVSVTHQGSDLAVSWAAPARATHYDVTYTDADAIAWQRAAWNRAGAGLTITANVDGNASIDAAKTYLVGVRARNAAGASAWVNSASASAAPPALSVADATVAEPSGGQSATLDFAVTLSRAASGTVTVDYATGHANDTATAGTDYTATTDTLTFAAGETAKTVSVPVLADSLDDGGETLTFTLSNASGAVISDATATGTITNDGPMPKAWLARFGRTVAADAIAAVTARLQTPRGAGSHLTVGGVRLPFGDAGSGNAGTAPGLPPAGGPGRASWPSWFGDPSGDVERTMSARELLMGTSFRAVLGSGAGVQWTGWGQGASVSAFSSAGPNLSLSGETATGSLGMDYERGRLLAGFAMTHSLQAEGTVQGSGRRYVMGSAVTTMLPYVRYALSERVSAWGLAGTGSGTLTLDLDGGLSERYGADLAMTLAALGVRGDLVTPAEAGGFALALEADAFWVRTESDAVSTPGVGNLAGARAEASRLRAVLDGSHTFSLAGGRMLTPQATLGLRHDGGDAETGTGMVLGAGLGYADPSRGLDMALRVHGLAAHRQDGYSEWGVSGSLRLVPGGAGRGLSASLMPSWGVDPGGSERLWMLPDAHALAANEDAPLSSRLDGELGYGLAVFGGGFTGTPNVGFGLSDTARELRMGWRLTPAGGGGFEVNLDAARREAANDDAPEHRIGLGVTARW